MLDEPVGIRIRVEKSSGVHLVRSPVDGDFLSCLILLPIECTEEDLEFKGLKFVFAEFDLDLSEGPHTIQVCQYKH